MTPTKPEDALVELLDDLALHAFDDCGGTEPPPTHIALLARDAITTLLERERRKDAALRRARECLIDEDRTVGYIDAALTGETK